MNCAFLYVEGSDLHLQFISKLISEPNDVGLFYYRYGLWTPVKKEGIVWSYTGWLYFVFYVQLLRKNGREICCKYSPSFLNHIATSCLV